MLIARLSKSYYLMSSSLGCGSTQGRQVERSKRQHPQLVGSWLPPLSQPGSSSLVSDVTLMLSESRPPAFKTGLLHTSKDTKLPTPKNAESHSKWGMGEEGARRQGSKGVLEDFPLGAPRGAPGMLQETPGQMPGEASRVCQTGGRAGGQVHLAADTAAGSSAAVESSASCSRSSSSSGSR